jgi:glycosyltransferase involved in cell wall biosynthesis
VAAPTASIIIPAHNQADHIAGIVDGYVAAMRRMGQSHEIIVVANNCRDDTADRCRALGAENSDIRVVELEQGGWGRAVKAGLIEARGDLLCYTNSARTTPEMLALVFAYGLAYPGVAVKANRRVRDHWRRRLGSLIYNLECRALFDLAIWDVNGTPKLFPRSFARLMELESDGDLIDAEWAMVCGRESYPVVEVPILATERHGGKSTTNYQSALKMYVGAYQLARRNR